MEKRSPIGFVAAADFSDEFSAFRVQGECNADTPARQEFEPMQFAKNVVTIAFARSSEA